MIQNALAHCCLAGKVNEGQKNKILEVSMSILQLILWLLFSNKAIKCNERMIFYLTNKLHEYSDVKWLIAINRIQNKSICLHNICVYTVYIYYVYINTNTCMYILKK